jgi:hypothetical protein
MEEGHECIARTVAHSSSEPAGRLASLTERSMGEMKNATPDHGLGRNLQDDVKQRRKTEIRLGTWNMWSSQVHWTQQHFRHYSRFLLLLIYSCQTLYIDV